MARSLKLVVAEGIETKAHDAFLSDLGCELGQGYLFSKPLAAADFTDYLLSQSGGNVEVLRGKGVRSCGGVPRARWCPV